MKTCNKCYKEQPIDNFYKQPGTVDGHKAQCKTCARAYSAAWAKKNPEYGKKYYKEHKDKSTNYYEEHKEEIKEKARLMRRANGVPARKAMPEAERKKRTKENQKRWATENRARLREYARAKRIRDEVRPRSTPRTAEEIATSAASIAVNQKAYRHANRHNYLENVAKHQAKKRSALPPWHAEEQIEMRKLYQLADIMRQWGEDAQVDHIVPLGGETVCGLHCLANLQIISAKANQEKGNHTWPDMP